MVTRNKRSKDKLSSSTVLSMNEADRKQRRRSSARLSPVLTISRSNKELSRGAVHVAEVSILDKNMRGADDVGARAAESNLGTHAAITFGAP